VPCDLKDINPLSLSRFHSAALPSLICFLYQTLVLFYLQPLIEGGDVDGGDTKLE